MAWVKLDDRYFANGKILKVSPGAVLLHIASMCHCASALNDGEFPLAELGIICAIARVQGEQVAELVQAGLWDEIGPRNAVTGYRVHDFLEYNPPAAKVRADRQRTTARVAKWRQAQRNVVTGDACNGIGNGVCNGAPLPLPLRNPDPNIVDLPKKRDRPAEAGPLTLWPNASSESPEAEKVRKVNEHYLTHHPKASKLLNPGGKEWRHIRDRLREGRTVEELCRAIDGYHADRWHIENRQLGLELIMRTASHVTKGIEFDEKPAGGDTSFAEALRIADERMGRKTP